MTLTENYQFLGRSQPLAAKSGANYYLLLYGKAVGDIPTGTWAVSLRLRLASTWDSHFYDWSTSGHAEADGKTVVDWSGKLIPGDPWQTALTENGVTYPRWTELREGTIPLAVEFGVPRELTLSASWVLDYGAADWLPPFGQAAQVQVQATLPALLGATVPQAAAESVLGQSLKIRMIPLLEGVTHRLRYRFGSESGVIYEGAQQEVTWTPPLELARQIPSATSGTAVLTCTSYRDGAQLGTAQETTVKLTLPDSVKPTAKASWEDLSGALDSLGVYAKGVSRLQVTVTGTGSYGSTITSAAVTLNGKPYTGGTVTASGQLKLVATVTDSRGRQGSKTYTLEVADYAAPTLTLDASRCDAGGNADDMGEYARVTVTAKTSAVGSNTAGLRLTWGGGEETVTLATGQATHQRIVPAPSTDAMKLTATLTDALFSAPAEMVLSVGYATVDFLDGGRGIAFGTTATREGFECAMPARFTGGVVMEWLGFDPDTGNITDTFQADLEAVFSRMEKYSCLQVQFVDPLLNGQKHMGTLWKYTYKYGFLTADNYSGVKAIKTYYGGTWNAWEWENPPMSPDVEYRTTERHKGSAVYTKLVHFGALPNAAEKSVTCMPANANMIYASGYASGSSYNMLIPGYKAIESMGSTRSSGTLWISTTKDMSGYEAWITIKYTK